MTQSALDQYALANGYGKTTSEMTEQEKVALRLAFVQKNYNFYGAKIHAYLKLQTSYAASESVSTLLDESYNPILDSTGDSIIATQAATKDIIESVSAKLIK